MTHIIAAIYTAYNPNSDVYQKLIHSLNYCEYVIVVDNTPGGSFLKSSGNLFVLSDGINKGLGAALNIGIMKAKSLGCTNVVLFDQDSSPTQELIYNLQQCFNSLNSSKACIAPVHLDDALFHTSEVSSPSEFSPVLVTCLPTSGMYFSILHFNERTLFTTDFFLDLVDFEWCWRLQTTGWSFFKVTDIFMRHRLGIMERKLFGFIFHVPEPFRHYFQFRDSLKLLSMPYVPLYSRFRLVFILFPKLLIYPIILDRRLERLNWMLKGIRDFIFSVNGPGSASSKLLAAKSCEF